VQSSHAADPAVQALVRGNPIASTPTRHGAPSRLPVGSAVFRIAGAPELEGALTFAPTTMLTSTVGDQTVCLLALDPARVPSFGRRSASSPLERSSPASRPNRTWTDMTTEPT
jgi:hypothetical protein